METLSYLDLAVADEASVDTHYTLAAVWKNPKLLNWLNSPQISTRAAIPLLSLTVVLGILGMARQASALAKPGDRSSEVSALQQRLQKLGYFKGNVTGYFGPLTKQAVMQYQQAKGLTPDGAVGASTQASLDEHHKSAAVEESPHPLWKVGDRDGKVREIQKTLAQAGYPTSTDGVFDQGTAEAVRLFQQAKGLQVDGIVGKQTLAALSAKAENESTPAPQNEPTPTPKKNIRWDAIEEPTQPKIEESAKTAWQIGDRGAKVSEIQKNLAAAGFNKGSDGLFDQETQEAVRQFQQAKGLKVDGVVGKETLAALSENPKENLKNEPKAEQKKTIPWYEDKSAPLAPFTR
ncbi:MAG TPA: peptidoglycan-binding protein [Waterburya sp.]|jgi:peptidoglycan hydrolase-like protein with peptidoglycan-binding domain